MSMANGVKLATVGPSHAAVRNFCDATGTERDALH